MPFDELRRGVQLPDPKARQAEDIKRAEGKKVKSLSSKSSVSSGFIKNVTILLSTVFGIAITAGIAYLIYIGFQTYING